MPSSASRPPRAIAAQDRSSGIQTSASRSATRAAASRPSTTAVSRATQFGPVASAGCSVASTLANELAVTTFSVWSQVDSASSAELGGPASAGLGPRLATATAPDVAATATRTTAAPQNSGRRIRPERCFPITLPVIRGAPRVPHRPLRAAASHFRRWCKEEPRQYRPGAKK